MRLSYKEKVFKAIKSPMLAGRVVNLFFAKSSVSNADKLPMLAGRAVNLTINLSQNVQELLEFESDFYLNPFSILP